MNQLLNCPSCGKLTSLQVSTSFDTRLSCPFCGSEFSASSLAAFFVPQWKVVDCIGNEDGVAPNIFQDVAPRDTVAAASSRLETNSTETHFVPHADLTPAIDLSFVRQTAEVSSALVGEDEAELTSNRWPKPKSIDNRPLTDWSTFQPLTHEQFDLMKSKDRAPVWSVLQIVFGGLAAIPVSLFLLWFLLDKDPTGFFGSGKSESVIKNEKSSTNGLQAENTPYAPENTETLTQPEPPPVVRATASRVKPAEPSVEVNDLATSSSTKIERAATLLEGWPAFNRSNSLNERKQMAKDIYELLISLAKDLPPLPVEDTAMQIVTNEISLISSHVQNSREVRDLIRQGSRHTIEKIAQSSPPLRFGEADDLKGLAIIIKVGKADGGNINDWIIEAHTENAAIGPESRLRIEIPRTTGLNIQSGQQLFLLGTINRNIDTGRQRYLFKANYCYLVNSPKTTTTSASVVGQSILSTSAR